MRLKVSSCAISRFSLDCISKFFEDCSSSISSARCELDELPDVSKILLELAVSATSLGWVTLTKIKTYNVKLVEKCLKGITPSYFSKYFQIRRNNSHHQLKLWALSWLLKRVWSSLFFTVIVLLAINLPSECDGRV